MRRFHVVVLTFILGCAQSQPPILLEPIPDENVTTIYSNGIPIASLNADSIFYLLSLDQVKVAGKQYFRLWVLVHNVADQTVLLDPIRLFRLRISQKGTSNNRMRDIASPASPTAILNDIEAEEASMQAINFIGGALEAMSAKNTTVRASSGASIEIGDAIAKRKAILRQANHNATQVSLWYNVFKSSINSGILRKNTLFSDQGVNGYVYFENRLVRSDQVFSIEDFDFSLLLETQSGSTTIDYTKVRAD